MCGLVRFHNECDFDFTLMNDLECRNNILNSCGHDCGVSTNILMVLVGKVEDDEEDLRK